MTNRDDYKAYLEENKELLTTLKKHNTLTYFRIANLIKVLNYILESKKIDKIYETIFDVGFNFLHATLEEIKEYLDIYFDNDYEAFIKQELYVNYILILDDLRLSIKEQTKLDEEDEEHILKMQESLETYLKKGRDIPKKVYREYQDYVQTLSHKYSDVRLTVEVFEEIHDKLMY